MGIKLGPLLETRPIKVEELANQKVAIDGYNILYQFLSSIRQADGNLLTDSEGRVTSHLSGLFFRISTLVDNGIRPCIVFDGKPPKLKRKLSGRLPYLLEMWKQQEQKPNKQQGWIRKC